MKHAGPEALEGLEPLVAELRRMTGNVERTRGVFYRRGRAFLHFHEDPVGLYCDVGLDPAAGFTRLPVTTAGECRRRLAEVRRVLTAGT